MSDSTGTSGQIELAKVAEALAHAIHAAYSMSLNGYGIGEKYRPTLEARVGDFVVEQTTFYRGVTRAVHYLDSVGVLERITHEPVEGDWDDEPPPTERVWYIRTLDGRSYRWVNARFIGCPRFAF